jgi:type 1 glutamine amidotransferase/HEAT repeat protein
MWKSWLRSVALVGVVLALLASPPVRAEVDQATRERIAAALPDAPPATPAEPRRVLIFTLCKGYPHGCIPVATEALRMLGSATNAYEADVSDDPQVFDARSLQRYDAVIFNNTTGELFEDAALRDSLMAYIRGGGGIVGIHAATDCFYEWPEFGAMMGGYFDGHPWHELVGIKIDDPFSPINAVFEGRSFEITDEIYQFREPYSREHLRVLLSLDTTRTNMQKNGIKRSDGDFAVSWIRGYGEGRVFYCSLGHRNEIFWNPVVLQHYLAGIQYAIGDLAADDTPSAEIGTPREPSSDLDEAMAGLRRYTFGESRVPLSVVEEHVRWAVHHPAEARSIESILMQLLGDDEVSHVAKGFICRQLALVGSQMSVPALSRLLADESLSHMARYALERIDSDAAVVAMREALTRTGGQVRIGLISSLGLRRDAAAVEVFQQIGAGADTETLSAIATALGEIGGDTAVEMLISIAAYAEMGDDPRLRSASADGMIRAGEQYMADGNSAAAWRLFVRLFDEKQPIHVRMAGLRGLAMTQPDRMAPVIARLLSEEDPVWRRTAVRVATEMRGPGVTELLAAQLAELPADAQPLLIEALAARGDRAALPAIVSIAEGSARGPADAAVMAMGALGDAAAVGRLVAMAADGSDAAQRSIARMHADGVDTALVDALPTADTDERIVILLALGARRSYEHADVAMNAAEHDEDPMVRRAAITTLGDLAGSDRLPEMIRIHNEARTEAEREAAIDAIVSICSLMGDPSRGVQLIVDARRTASLRAQASLLIGLGRLGGPLALEDVVQCLDASNGMIVAAALEALGEWPDAAAAPYLAEHVGRGQAASRSTALVGLVRAVQLEGDLTSRDRVRLLDDALRSPLTDAQIRLVLEALRELGHVDGIVVASPYLEMPALQGAAADAMLQIARRTGHRYRAESEAVFDRLEREFPDDEDLAEAIADARQYIERFDGFVTTWQVSGPYQAEGVGAQELFHRSFPPEQGGGTWAECPDTIKAPGILDLTAVSTASNCCVYVKVILHAEEAMPVRLELGSDDGVKVFLNGEVVHGANVMRGLSVGQDVCEADLQAGDNVLMLKVTQGGGGFAVVCRVRAPDGGRAEGVTIR